MGSEMCIRDRDTSLPFRKHIVIRIRLRFVGWLFLFDYSIPVVYYNQIKATISLYIVKRKYICGWILMVALFSERYGYIKVIVITG